MGSASSIVIDVKSDLLGYFRPPQKNLNTLVLNGLVSVLFFLGSYFLGSNSPSLLPIAASTILLWTLADASISNQLIFDKNQAAKSLKTHGSLRHYFLVKNIVIVIISIPLTLIYGLVLVAIIGSWNELLYGAVAASMLVWGWLGICNAISVILPFEIVDVKTYAKNHRMWLPYGILYGLPWVLLPAYALIMGLPFVLLGWTRADAETNHRLVSIITIFTLSVIIWLIGFSIANQYSKKPNRRLNSLLG